MSSDEASDPPALAFPAPGRREGLTRRRPRRPGANNLQTVKTTDYRVHINTFQELECEPADVVQVFEEFSHRAQARKLLWEFFD